MKKFTLSLTVLAGILAIAVFAQAPKPGGAPAPATTTTSGTTGSTVTASTTGGIQQSLQEILE